MGEAVLLTERSALAGLTTLSINSAVCMVGPVWPLTLMVWLPSGVPAVVDSVSVEVFEEASVMFTVEGLNTALAPAGSDDAVRFTAPVKPASGVTVIVYWADEPGTTFLDDGETATEKSGVVDAGAAATKVLYI